MAKTAHLLWSSKLKPQDYAHIIAFCVNEESHSTEYDYTNRLDARVRDGAGDAI
jgi:hypothetical protein